MKQLAHSKKLHFVKMFQDAIVDMTAEDVADMVWRFGNEQWSHGYSLGIRGYKKDRHALENAKELLWEASE